MISTLSSWVEPLVASLGRGRATLAIVDSAPTDGHKHAHFAIAFYKRSFQGGCPLYLADSNLPELISGYFSHACKMNKMIQQKFKIGRKREDLKRNLLSEFIELNIIKVMLCEKFLLGKNLNIAKLEKTLPHSPQGSNHSYSGKCLALSRPS